MPEISGFTLPRCIMRACLHRICTHVIAPYLLDPELVASRASKPCRYSHEFTPESLPPQISALMQEFAKLRSSSGFVARGNRNFRRARTGTDRRTARACRDLSARQSRRIAAGIFPHSWRRIDPGHGRSRACGARSTIARTYQAVVVSVDYRLAPETPFPGPIEGLLRRVPMDEMTAQNAKTLGIDTKAHRHRRRERGRRIGGGSRHPRAGSRCCTHLRPDADLSDARRSGY